MICMLFRNYKEVQKHIFPVKDTKDMLLQLFPRGI